MHDSKRVVDDTLTEIQDQLVKQAWELYRKLSGTYEHRSLQWEDMRALGELGTALIKIDEARESARRANRT
jgi:hypothetical protein